MGGKNRNIRPISFEPSVHKFSVPASDISILNFATNALLSLYLKTILGSRERHSGKFFFVLESEPLFCSLM